MLFHHAWRPTMSTHQKKLVCGMEITSSLDYGIIAELDSRFPERNRSAEEMAGFAMALAAAAKNISCSMPFCNTVEAEALGAKINMGDAISGPRPGGYIYENLEQLKEHLGHIDFSAGRIHEVIKACSVAKKQGYLTIIEICGPLNILNCLVEFSAVVRAWRKHENLVVDIFRQIGTELKTYVKILKTAGADVISFADPMAAEKIIGPRYAAGFAELFLLPFMRDMEPLLDSMIFHICPKTSHMLTDLQYARWEPEFFTQPVSYEEAIAKSIGKKKFMGYLCIHRTSQHLADGISYTLQIG